VLSAFFLKLFGFSALENFDWQGRQACVPGPLLCIAYLMVLCVGTLFQLVTQILGVLSVLYDSFALI
jgi:hypothetical protein